MKNLVYYLFLLSTAKKGMIGSKKILFLPIIGLAIIGFFIALFSSDKCTKILMSSAIFFFINYVLFKFVFTPPLNIFDIKFNIEIWTFKLTIPTFLIFVILFIILQRVGLCS